MEGRIRETDCKEQSLGSKSVKEGREKERLRDRDKEIERQRGKQTER